MSINENGNFECGVTKEQAADNLLAAVILTNAIDFWTEEFKKYAELGLYTKDELRYINAGITSMKLVLRKVSKP